MSSGGFCPLAEQQLVASHSMTTVPADATPLSLYGYATDSYMDYCRSGPESRRLSRMSIAPSQVFVLPPDATNKDPNQSVHLLVVQSETGLSPLSIITIVSYAMLALHSIIFEEVCTLYAVTPLTSHGLGWNAIQLSTTLASMGLAQLFIQFIVYPKLQRRFSAVSLFQFAQLLYVCVYIGFPMIRAFAVNENSGETAGQTLRVRCLVLAGLIINADGHVALLGYKDQLHLIPLIDVFVLSMPITSVTQSESFSSTTPSGLSVLRSVSYSPGALASWNLSFSNDNSSHHDDHFRINGTSRPPGVMAYSMAEQSDNKDIRGSATVGVPTAVARSMLLQALQFWYRVPIKLFRPMRVDYLVMARAATMGLIPTPADRLAYVQNSLKQTSRRSQFFRATSIGMLAHAIQTQGAGFVFRQVLPPLIMNSFIGSVLYTTYIFTLPIFHPAFTYQKSRTFPPPPFPAVFMAGALAGAAQSLVAAPMDSLKIKFQVQDLGQGGRHKNMASFAITTLKELGLKTVYRGYALTLVKDSLACGLFFGVFEWVKQQGYYYFIDELYGIREDMDALKARMTADYNALSQIQGIPTTTLAATPNLAGGQHDDDTALSSSSSIASSRERSISTTASSIADSASSSESPRPYFLLEPTFVLLAGAAAAVAYQAVDYPMEQIKNIFFAKETALQVHKDLNPQSPHSQHLNSSSMRSGTSISTQLYQMTWEECKVQANHAGGWRRFLFGNFASTAIRAVPAASVGFLVFEVMKRKLDARMYESEDREMALYLDRMMVEREVERREETKAAMGQERQLRYEEISII
ncbi:hypothetical protein EDD11_000719 [Mortierella claussenii]|nr:hypothetical protein EDD11_000719 [Mortierella claussenii]